MAMAFASSINASPFISVLASQLEALHDKLGLLVPKLIRTSPISAHIDLRFVSIKRTAGATVHAWPVHKDPESPPI